jgi:hypothetical protein
MTVRIARCCEKCSWRAFGEAAASCPEHGTRATYTDRNRSYKGQAVAQAAENLPEFVQGWYATELAVPEGEGVQMAWWRL